MATSSSHSSDCVLWDSLPVEAQKALLFRVPWQDLCRLRLVRKEWDRLITEREFDYFHATSTHRRPESCVLSTRRNVLVTSWPEPRRIVEENDLGWHLLDMAANRTYTIPDTFIREALLRDATPGTSILRTYTMAAGGGLIYTAYNELSDRSIVANCHRVVCNPASRSFHKIPHPPGEYRNLFTMVVDSATQRYRILNIRLGNRHSGKVYLYDSWVQYWRMLYNAQGAAPHRPRSCVILDGILYALTSERNRDNELYSFVLETGKWGLIDVALPRPPLRPRESKARSQVVAAGGCLFFVGYSGRAAEDVITVTVWKFFALGESSRPRVTLVAQLPRFFTYRNLSSHDKKSRVVAAGCGDSIIVSNLVGRRVRWDVLQGIWYPMEPMIDSGSVARHSFFVSAMELQMQPIDASTTARIPVADLLRNPCSHNFR